MIDKRNYAVLATADGLPVSRRGEQSPTVLQDELSSGCDKLRNNTLADCCSEMFGAYSVRVFEAANRQRLLPERLYKGSCFSFLLVFRGNGEISFADGESLCLSSEWGALTNSSDGEVVLSPAPGESIKLFRASLAIRKVENLFYQQDLRKENYIRLMSNKGGARRFRINSAMQQVIQGVFKCQLQGGFRQAFIETSALQLFILIFSQILGESKRPIESKPELIAHKNALVQAKEILLSDLQNPPAVAQLAQQVGVNIHQLNHGFKQLYLCTPYEFLARRRLQYARQLLESNPRYPLKVLAQNLGYRHASNFITAFKREFSSTPKQYAKKFTKFPVRESSASL